jgi:hypothetical protein
MEYFCATKFSVNTMDPKFTNFFRITLTFTVFDICVYEYYCT